MGLKSEQAIKIIDSFCEGDNSPLSDLGSVNANDSIASLRDMCLEEDSF